MNVTIVTHVCKTCAPPMGLFHRGCKTQYNFRDVFRTGGGLTRCFVKFLFSNRKLKIIHQWRAY